MIDWSAPDDTLMLRRAICLLAAANTTPTDQAEANDEAAVTARAIRYEAHIARHPHPAVSVASSDDATGSQRL